MRLRRSGGQCIKKKPLNLGVSYGIDIAIVGVLVIGRVMWKNAVVES